jgi:hypothetical protein
MFAGAGNILDQERRAPDFRKPIGKNARREVGSRAGGEANQDFHRPVRIIGLRRSRLRREQHNNGEHAHARAFEKDAPLHGVHGFLPA